MLNFVVNKIALVNAKTDKSQINDAMSRYKSSHGIIISNTTSEIVQKGDIIYIPPEIFAFM